MDQTVWENATRMAEGKGGNSLQGIVMSHGFGGCYFRYDPATGLILGFARMKGKDDEWGVVQPKLRKGIFQVGNNWSADTKDSRVRNVLKESFEQLDMLMKTKALKPTS